MCVSVTRIEFGMITHQRIEVTRTGDGSVCERNED